MLQYKFLRISDFDDDKLEVELSLLSDNQKSYINRLVANKRKQSLCVRSLLNTFLCEYKIPLSSLEFSESGKPVIIGSNLHISFTHSNEYVGCALSEHPVGIDIEKIRTVKPALIKRVCDTDEQEYLSNSDISDFFTLWTLKEAFIKASNSKISKMSEISFVNDGKIIDNHLTGQIEDYKWSLVTINAD